jgi:hypothetical protein
MTYQIGIVNYLNPGLKDITTFRTRFGQYKYQIFPFGLTGEPSTF